MNYKESSKEKENQTKKVSDKLQMVSKVEKPIKTKELKGKHSFVVSGMNWIFEK